MSYTLGKAGIVRGLIHHSASGAWTADLALASEVALTGKQTLSLPGLDLIGTIIEGGVSGVHQSVRMVGGMGGLSSEAKGQHFNRAQVRTVVNDILGKVGEQLAPDSDSAILSRQLDHWQHVTSTAGSALDLLMKHVGSIWYVDKGGKIHIGDHAWLPAEIEHALLSEDLVGRSWTISALDETVQPGTLFLGERVTAVEHVISSARARTVVRWDSDGHPFDEGFRDLVQHFQHRTLPAYGAEVVTQNADGTLDCKPTDPSIGPGWKGVPIALIGLFQVRVQAGGGCIVEFLDNDRTKPIVRQFLPGTVFTSAEMASGAESARKGDAVGYLIIVYVTVLGAPVLSSVTWSAIDPGFPPFAGPVVGSWKIAINITSGSAIVKKVA